MLRCDHAYKCACDYRAAYGRLRMRNPRPLRSSPCILRDPYRYSLPFLKLLQLASLLLYDCTQNSSGIIFLGSVTSADTEKSNFELMITATIASVGLVFIAVVCILAAVIIFLVRSRSTIRTELKRLQVNANVVYDVIATPPSIIKAKTNVAYDSVTVNSGIGTGLAT